MYQCTNYDMKVFIIGIKGRVAKRHIIAWQSLGWVVTGCGSDKDFRQEIEKLKPNVVDICTPIYLHAYMIETVTRMGYPVICEKPVGISIDEANRISHLRGKIGIVYQFRFNPKVLQLKKEIEEGVYGEIKMVTAHYYRWRGWEYYNKWEHDKHKAGGGAVVNVCIHYLDLLQWIFGYPTDIKGFTTTAKQGIDVEDNAVGILKFPTDAIGSVIFSNHVNPPKHFELSVYGTKGHKTIQLRQNEYHKQNFEAFIKDENFVDPMEAAKSLRMALEIIK